MNRWYVALLLVVGGLFFAGCNTCGPLCQGISALFSNADFDRDGFTPGTGDCDDTNAAVHPRAREQCNGIDDDCDEDIDEGFSYCDPDESSS